LFGGVFSQVAILPEGLGTTVVVAVSDVVLV
jgi:hypothetical protein